MRRGILVALLSLASACAEVTVFQDFTLIDGSGHSPQSKAAMIVVDGRIQWVGPASRLKAPKDAVVVRLPDKFVMPGIINLHGHIGNVVGLAQDKKFFTRENVEKDLRTYASYGVTTVLSLGTDQDLIFDIRAEQRRGRPAFTRVFTAGQGFTAKNGYGGMKGVTYEVENAAEVEKDVAEQAAKKVDFIKVWVDDHLGKNKKIPLDVVKAIIESSRRHNLKVVAHIFYLDDARELVDAGLYGLAHSVRDKPVDRALIDSMKQHGAWQLAATLTREESVFIYDHTPPFLDDPFFTRAVAPDVIATLKSAEYQKRFGENPDVAVFPGYLETAKKNLKKLVDAGVKYGFGTDSGPPGRFHGYFEHREMELMQEAGLTPMQVIEGATRNAAEFLGANDLGTLTPGKWADMIVLGKDPLDDVFNTRSIEAVYIAGQSIPPHP